MNSFHLRFSLFILGLVFSLSALAQGLSNKSALVIIDMQPYFAERGEHDKDEGNVIKLKQILDNQVKLIKKAKETKTPIIFIEYVNCGKTSEVLTKAAEGYSDVQTIEKSSDGMFDDNSTKEKLQTFLTSRGIGKLIITGANGGACVEESIRGSLENNYSVYAIADGIADFNYDEFIFPYVKKYESFNKPNCQSCSFKEAEHVEEADDVMTPNSSSEKTEAVHNSERNSGKDIPEKKNNNKQNNNKKQEAAVQ